MDNGLLNSVVFLDFTKAFGTVDHEIVLLKLSSYGMNQPSGSSPTCQIVNKDVMSMENYHHPKL